MISMISRANLGYDLNEDVHLEGSERSNLDAEVGGGALVLCSVQADTSSSSPSKARQVAPVLLSRTMPLSQIFSFGILAARSLISLRLPVHERACLCISTYIMIIAFIT